MNAVLATTGHVGINVTDLARSVEFYRSALGLDVLGRSDDDGRRYAFLGADGALVLTLWEQATSGFSAQAAGLHHLSFQADDIEQVEAAEARLKAMGADFAYDGVVPHGEGATSGGIFFTDPDGTRLEVFAPAGATGSAPAADGPTCGFF
jgi:catechol 2,3-dioxygenase-like lactoylglutathione lyase family enzyme